MSKPACRLWLAFLSTLALTVFIPGVECKRGGSSGGGSSGGDSGDSGGSSSGGSSSGGSSSGGASDNCAPVFPGDNSYLNWLDRWVGTYYNGTIEIRVKIDSDNTTCSAQDTVFAQTLDGVLGLIDPKYMDTTSSFEDPGNPLIVALDGWVVGDVPPRQVFRGEQPYSLGGIVGKDELAQGASIIPEAPKQVVFEMNTFGALRGDSSLIGTTGQVPCAITLNPKGQGYNITAAYSTLGDPTDKWLLAAPTCSNSETADLIVQQLRKDLTANINASLYGVPAPDSTSMTGSFSPDEAEITWKGRMQAHFLGTIQEEADLLFKLDAGFYQGDFEVQFRGSVDGSRSHSMQVGRGNVTWLEDSQKTSETNMQDSNCRSGSGSGGGSGSASGGSMLVPSCFWGLVLVFVWCGLSGFGLD